MIKHMLAVIGILLMGLGLQNNVYAEEENVMSDTAITTKIKGALVGNKMTSASDIHVETINNGVVKLSGQTKSKAEAEEAINIASRTEGVSDIDTSGLSIQGSKQPLTDSVITAKIKAEFIRAKIMSDSPVAVTSVHVETNDGEVILTGEVDNEAQASNAVNLSKNVKGVRNVRSNLTVKK